MKNAKAIRLMQIIDSDMHHHLYFNIHGNKDSRSLKEAFSKIHSVIGYLTDGSENNLIEHKGLISRRIKSMYSIYKFQKHPGKNIYISYNAKIKTVPDLYSHFKGRRTDYDPIQFNTELFLQNFEYPVEEILENMQKNDSFQIPERITALFNPDLRTRFTYFKA